MRLTTKLLTRIPERIISSGILLIIGLFIYGIVGSILIMHLNLIDSIYYATITMATVGYGDYTPILEFKKYLRQH